MQYAKPFWFYFNRTDTYKVEIEYGVGSKPPDDITAEMGNTL